MERRRVVRSDLYSTAGSYSGTAGGSMTLAESEANVHLTVRVDGFSPVSVPDSLITSTPVEVHEGITVSEARADSTFPLEPLNIGPDWYGNPGAYRRFCHSEVLLPPPLRKVRSSAIFAHSSSGRSRRSGCSPLAVQGATQLG